MRQPGNEARQNPFPQPAKMLPTPNTDHIDPLTTYEPAEDSYLVLDTLQTQRAFLAARFPAGTPPPLVLELGTGSGIISAFVGAHAAALFGRADVVQLGTDANALACAATAATLRVAGAHARFLGALHADLCAPLRARVADVLLFNPPYVPTEAVPALVAAAGASAHDEESRLLALTYAGGADGMEVTRRVFAQLDGVLSARGVAYVLLTAANRPAAVADELRAEGWTCEQVGASGRRGGIEKLSIWRIWK